MSITLTAKNFGPVTSGTVKLLPFNVFIGANNTGKSFMSTLIYASQINRRSIRTGTVRYLPPTPGLRVSPQLITEIRNHVHARLQHRDPDLRNLFKNASKITKDAIREVVRVELSSYTQAVTAELERCLGGTINDLVRVGRTKQGVMQLSIASESPTWSVSISCDGDKVTRRVVRMPTQRELIMQANRLALEALADYVQPELSDDGEEKEEIDPIDYLLSHPYLVQQMSEEFTSLIVRQIVIPQMRSYLFSGFPTNRHYLPAARSGIMQSHKSLAEFLIRSAPLVGLQQMSIPQLSGIVTDFISQLLNLDFERRRGRPSNNLEAVAQSLESGVLHGNITIRAEPNTYPEILYQAGELEAPLVRLSSMISELAPVVLYIRYVLVPGDHLIIEEPEAHLHPESQRKFARALVRLRASGVNITLTTHSDYLLTEINNLIRTGSIAEAEKTDRPSVSIPYSEVAAYLFKSSDGRGGTTIRRLSISDNDGIPDEEFGKVAEAIYNEAADLEYRLILAGSDKQ
jgi:predicted ATPase